MAVLRGRHRFHDFGPSECSPGTSPGAETPIGVTTFIEAGGSEVARRGRCHTSRDSPKQPRPDPPSRPRHHFFLLPLFAAPRSSRRPRSRFPYPKEVLEHRACQSCRMHGGRRPIRAEHPVWQQLRNILPGSVRRALLGRRERVSPSQVTPAGTPYKRDPHGHWRSRVSPRG